MKKGVLSIFIAMVVCVGCSKAGTDTIQAIVPLKVDVKTNPEVIKLNEKVEISAIVTQGTDKVDDASEVKFEIWKNNEEKHDMFVAKHTKDGTYVVEKTFTSSGTYTVVAHTTARSLHEMPKVELKVEQSDTPVVSATTAAADHDDDHASTIQLEAMGLESPKANQDINVMVHVMNKDKMVSGATVGLEIWKDGDEKHQFTDAKEDNDKMYDVTVKFPSAGQYNVKIHMKQGETHEHKVEKVTVK